MTPLRRYFIDYAKADIPVKDVTKVNPFTRIGTTTNKFIDTNGVAQYLPVCFIIYFIQMFAYSTHIIITRYMDFRLKWLCRIITL